MYVLEDNPLVKWVGKSIPIISQSQRVIYPSINLDRFPTPKNFRTLLLCSSYKPLTSFHSRRINYSTNLSIHLPRSANFQFPSSFPQSLNKLIINSLLNNNPRSSDTGLSTSNEPLSN